MKLRLGLVLMLAVGSPLFADYGTTIDLTYQIGGTVPAPVSESLTSTTQYQVTNLAIRTSGQPWIGASLSSTSTPTILTIVVNPIGLAVGNFSGTVEVYSPNSTNVMDFFVNLSVTPAPPPFTASPLSLTFNAVQGSSAPPSQTLVIGGSLPSGTMITSSSTPPSWLNTGWIAVGTAPMSIPISINSSFTTLAPGTYTTSLIFQAPFTSQQVTVNITLNVTAPPPVLKTSVSQLQFSYMSGGTIPPAQTIQITSSSTALGASITTNASWLSVTTPTGTTPFSTNVTVNPTGLGVGTYSGQLTVATILAGPSAPSITITVTLTITVDNRPSITAVVNGASFKPTISPGSWVTIMGKNLSPTVAQATSSYLYASLNGVTAGISGPGGSYSLLMYYVSPTQINAFEPYEVSPMMFGASSTQLTVTTPIGSTTASVDCEVISPALFVVNSYAAAILYPDNSIIGTAAGMKPASSGSIVSLYGTGFGQTSPASSNVTGPVNAAPLASTPTVTIGGVPAQVLWAGMVSMGLYQINIQVPMMPGPGDYPVVVTINGVSSPSVPLPLR